MAPRSAPKVPRTRRAPVPAPIPRDRVVALRRVPASALRDHPLNWRQHPPEQRAAMRDLLGDVGFVKPLDVYQARAGDVLVTAGKLAAGDLVIMDGHLRRATGGGDFQVPVNLTDLSEAEAMLYLGTCDPLSGMATQDSAALLELLANVDSDSAAVQTMLAALVNVDDEHDANEGNEPAGKKIRILLTCEDEAQRDELLEEFAERGIIAKAQKRNS